MDNIGTSECFKPRLRQRASALSVRAGSGRVVTWPIRVLILLALLVQLTPGLNGRVAAAENGKVTLSVGTGVTAEDLSYVVEGVTLAQSYAASTLSTVSESVVVNVRASDDTTGRGAVAFYTGGYMVVFTGSPGWISMAPFDRVHVAVHEFIHAWQDGIDGDSTSQVPAWLTEGLAEYLSYDAVSRLGLVNQGAVRDYQALLVSAAADLAPLPDLEQADAFYGEHGPTYSLAYLAVDQLISASSPESLVDFFRGARFVPDWRNAFSAAFGLEATDFYRAFATNMDELIAPRRIPASFDFVFAEARHSPVSIDTSPATVNPGEQLLIQANSEPGAICQFQLDSGGDSGELTGTTFADATGRFFWLVTVPTSIDAGPANVAVECGAEQAEITVEITNGH